MAAVPSDLASFGVLDYVVFTVMLSISLGIGVFFAFRGNKNPEDFLMGGRKMSVLPVSISLLSSFISAISILGYSGETYAHGVQLSVLLVGAAFGIFMATTIFLPVFYPLKLTSITEYIEMRFQSKVLRIVALLMTTVTGLLYTGLCLYAPTLALSSVTPISVDNYIIILGVVCTIYSTIGGLKAVVWTDTFQMLIIVLGIVAIIVVGCLEVGGIQKVWAISSQHGRTELFDMRVNPYQRHNFWNIFVMGATIYFAMYGANQTNLQRACSVPTLNDAKKVYLINLAGMIVTVAMVFFSGLCAFASYAGCDPIALGHIFTKDQILPYFVMDKIGSYGMPGLFVATLLSGALSSMSSVINAVVAMVWADLDERVPFFHNMSKTGAALTNKIISCMVGAIMVGLAFLCKGFGGLFQAAFTILGALAGPTTAVFTMGLLFPHIGKKSAFCGLAVSIGIMSWIITGAHKYNPRPEPLPFSSDQCNISQNSTLGAFSVSETENSTIVIHDINATTISTSLKHRWDNVSVSKGYPLMSEGVVDSSVETEATTLASAEDEDHHETSIDDWPLMYVYGISYTLYTPIGVVLAIVAALLSIPFTGSQDLTLVSPELIAPVCRRFLPEKSMNGSKGFSASYSPIGSELKDLRVPPPHMMHHPDP